jgi:hypothetical protein
MHTLQHFGGLIKALWYKNININMNIGQSTLYVCMYLLGNTA